jgi:hypothetical protein
MSSSTVGVQGVGSRTAEREMREWRASRMPVAPTTAAPERSRAQRRYARALANQIRTAHKRELKAGRASIHLLLMNPPDYMETAKVFDILLSVPKYGRVKVSKVLQVCRISPSKTIGGMSERQRAELVSMLRR